ncbi:MAG TPA: protein-disulfide reductase DsbD domain-containing protein [Stellaceae bacterium]|nr:protein-disulfide reductase DsbD domain-containing protein [Stellaceae bacterium]
MAIAILLPGGPPAQAGGPAAPVDPVAARLIPEATAIAPGQTLWVDLHLEMAPGWHTYWQNPGDSGLPTTVDWKMPAGFRAGGIVWPVPERFVQGNIGNYGYAGAADLLVPVTAPAGVAPGSAAHLAAHASWLVCSDICIPGAADLRLDLPVAAAAVPPDPKEAALFAQARARLPQKPAFPVRVTASGREVRVLVPKTALAGLDRPHAAFFPLDANTIDVAAAPRTEAQPGGLAVALRRASGPTASLPATLHGDLLLTGDGGTARVFAVAAPVAAAPAAAADRALAARALSSWQALLLAFLGGVVLNLMPCVFPVLSLKVLGFATAVQRAEERRHGYAYGAGVVLSFALLGGALLGLRAAGAAVGWGFQLQSPIVVALLAYLMLAMGLSLSGAAEFGLSLAGTGGRFAARSGMAGAFSTGVLATIVATPCTAPFMGAALGFALVAPTALALAIFVMLGIGLAAPVVLLGAVPRLARWMPRPGRWMGWFKKLLALPLYGTVIWLLWVLSREVGPRGMVPALLGLAAVAAAVWVYGSTRAAGGPGRRLGAGVAGGAVAAAVFAAAILAPAGLPALAGTAGSGLDYRPFSTARLTALTAGHRPVFVNLTAAWCITCLINERTTLDSAAVRQAFASHGIVALKGDWTRRDADITAFLQKFGRSGVPLYLLYDRTGRAVVLPQILTVPRLVDAAGKI